MYASQVDCISMYVCTVLSVGYYVSNHTKLNHIMCDVSADVVPTVAIVAQHKQRAKGEQKGRVRLRVRKVNRRHTWCAFTAQSRVSISTPAESRSLRNKTRGLLY